MFQEVQTPRFQNNRHLTVVWLSALRTGRLYHPGNILGTLFFEAESMTGVQHGWIVNSNDTFGIRIRELPIRFVVLQNIFPYNDCNKIFSDTSNIDFGRTKCYARRRINLASSFQRPSDEMICELMSLNQQSRDFEG